MDVTRIDKNNFHVFFTLNEVEQLERFADTDNKQTWDFIKWLLRVGLEIFNLTNK